MAWGNSQPANKSDQWAVKEANINTRLAEEITSLKSQLALKDADIAFLRSECPLERKGNSPGFSQAEGYFWKNRAEVAQKDRERLDWLDATERGQKGGFFVWPSGEIASGCITSGQPIREALDNAMEAQNGE